MTEKKSNYGRIDYRVNWVALAEALSLDANTVQTDEDLDDFDLCGDDDSLDANTVQGQFGRYSDESSLDAITVQANAEDYAGDYLTGKTLLQRAPEPVCTEPGANEMNGKRDKGGLEQPLNDQRHSQDGHAPSKTTAMRLQVAEPVAPPKPDDDTLLAEVKEILDSNSGRWSYACYIKNGYAPEKVAGYIINNAEDIERPEVVTSVPRDELEQAVGYVLWEVAA